MGDGYGSNCHVKSEGAAYIVPVPTVANLFVSLMLEGMEAVETARRTTGFTTIGA